MGLEPERLEMFNVVSAEGPRFAAICKEMSERAHKLGPSPVKREARAVWLAAQKAASRIQPTRIAAVRPKVLNRFSERGKVRAFDLWERDYVEGRQ